MAVEAIRNVHNKTYTYGRSAVLTYIASGGADDWTLGALNVTWSYSVELGDTGWLWRRKVHPRFLDNNTHYSVCMMDAGRYGFFLPASEIVPTGEEVFAAVRVMAKYIVEACGR